MQAPCSGAVERRQARERSLAELRVWERQLTLPSVNEAIRLLESEKFQKLTARQLQCIAEYSAIRIDEEFFFDKAFSTGKEVAACLAYAMEIGGEEVLEDMARLRLTVVGSSAAPS